MKFALMLLPLALGACATTQTAKQFKFISYEDTATSQKSIGAVEGRDCSWSVLGYSLGQPTVRSAFSNAASQKKAGFIPGQTSDGSGAQLKTLRNVSVENDGFHAWVISRSCIVVAGEGFQ